jgi:pimeloyl-ACP methyl ester carboxylesterase
MRKQGIDLRQYNSKRVAQDVEALRKALGIAQWNLHGISYGTRLAYTVARYFPKTVRSMVLDAPMLPESNPTLDDALGTEHALKRLGERCAQQPACNARFPEVFDRFRDGLGFYRESPAHDEVFTLDNRVLLKFVKTHFQSDEIMPFDRRALETLEMMDAIGRHDLATVRRIVEAAEAETAPPPAPKSTPASTPAAPPPPDPPYLHQAFGQKWSVDCNEEKPFESLQEWERAGRTDPIVDGDLKDMRYRFGICEQWPSGQADPVENQPVDYDGPQLIFSGELDPSLSGIVGETIARRYPKARNVVFANAWHGQMKTGDVYASSPFNAYRMCAVRLMHAFTDNPSARLNTSCARRRASSISSAYWQKILPAVVREILLPNRSKSGVFSSCTS